MISGDRLQGKRVRGNEAGPHVLSAELHKYRLLKCSTCACQTAASSGQPCLNCRDFLCSGVPPRHSCLVLAEVHEEECLWPGTFRSHWQGSLFRQIVCRWLGLKIAFIHGIVSAYVSLQLQPLQAVAFALLLPSCCRSLWRARAHCAGRPPRTLDYIVNAVRAM